MNEQVRPQRKPLPPIFRMAVLAGVKASVQLHIRRGIDINATDEQGRTPLILAASRGHVEICRLLLEAGADPARRDDKGNDALAAASARGQAELMELLRGALSATAGPNLSQEAPPADPIAWEADDAIDLSSWEEETETPPPASDPSCLAEASDLQWQISRHAPIDTDAAWDDIDLDLPEESVSASSRARGDADEEWAIRKLLVAAMRDGRIQGWRIAAALPRSEEDAELPNAELEANLRTVLGDLGVIIDDDPFAPDLPGDTEGDEDDERYDEQANQALAFLRRLNSNEADALSLYIRGLPKGLLSREDVFALGTAIEEGRRDVLVAIISCPSALAELRSTADGVASGTLPVETMVDLEDAEKGPAEDLPDNDDAEAGELPGAARPVPQELLSRISAVRDLCRKISASTSGPTPSKLSETLGEQLLALHLSPDFEARLRHIVEADPQGVEARLRMEAGWEKVRKARRRLFDSNLRLVYWVARGYSGLPLQDRIQEGLLGLLKAVERFDHHRGTTFSTYARWWIMQSITRATADKGRTIRLPVHMTEVLRKIVKAQAKTLQLTGREATAEELSGLSGLPPAKIWKLLVLQDEPVSMDSDEGWREVEEIADLQTPSPEELCATEAMKLAIRELLEDLSPREATILRMRFGIGGNEHTLEEVGEQFDFTRERARQIEAKALRKLKHPRRLKRLEDLL